MTVDKCNECVYSENRMIDFGDSVFCCGKTTEPIKVSLMDFKTVINKCPIEESEEA